MERCELILAALRGEISCSDLPSFEGVPVSVVYIKPLDLLPMLQRYLVGEIDESELQGWADWVLNQEEFDVERAEANDNVADYHEPMWYVLQQLSTPFIDGPITKERVREHVGVLSRL